MSQQPRRRRRRRRGRGGQGKKPQEQQESASQHSQREAAKQQPKAEGGSRRRRRRGRGRSRGGGEHAAAPAKSSEDIVRAPNRKRPDTLTLPPDERRLEDIIGSLQSEMGVPQNPQEYRLTVKVAEERDGHHRTKPASKNGPAESSDKPKREKAPAPPRVGAGEGPTADREAAPPRKRRSRRRRRGGRNRGGGGEGR